MSGELTRTVRQECQFCHRSDAVAGLQTIAPGSPVFVKDPGLDGTVLCQRCRYDVLVGRV